MTSDSSTYQRRFVRSSDRALCAGVCAGLADYFGFNLKVTRVLVFIGFLMNPPLAILAYLAVVVLVPSRPTKIKEPTVDPEFRQSLRSSPAKTMSDVRARFRSLDRRLAGLEKYVTSSRFSLDQEFKDLQN